MYVGSILRLQIILCSTSLTDQLTMAMDSNGYNCGPLRNLVGLRGLLVHYCPGPLRLRTGPAKEDLCDRWKRLRHYIPGFCGGTGKFGLVFFME